MMLHRLLITFTAALLLTANGPVSGANALGDIEALIDQSNLSMAQELIDEQLGNVESLDDDELINLLSLQGDVHYYLDEIKLAREQYHLALELAESAAGGLEQAAQMKNIAISYSGQRQYGKSLQWHQRAWQRLEQANALESTTAMQILLSQGVIYGYIGAIELASETLNRVRDMAIRHGHEHITTNATIRLAAIYFESGLYETAIDIIETVELASIGDMTSLGWYYGIHAGSLIEIGESTRARQVLTELMQAQAKIGVEHAMGYQLMRIETHLIEDNLQRARQILDRINRAGQVTESDWVYAAIEARSLQHEGQHQRALERYIEAILAMSRVMDRQSREAPERFFNLPRWLFVEAIDSAIRANAAEAEWLFQLFWYAHLGKEPAHTFASDASRVESDSMLTSDIGETEFLNDVNSLASLFRWPGRATISQLQSVMEHDEALLMYVVGKKTTYGLLVWQDGIRAVDLDVRPGDLSASVIELIGLLDTRDPQWTHVAASLHQQLIQPFRVFGLDRFRELHLVQDHNLRFMPIDVLLDQSGEMLVDRHQITVATVRSLNRYIELKAMAPAENPETFSDGIAVVARSDGMPSLPSYWRTAYRQFDNEQTYLPNAAREAGWLDRLAAGTHVLLDDQATETAARQLISAATGVVHLAVHGFDNPMSPAYSSLVMGGDQAHDGLLQAREIGSLKTRARLFVLASCASAKGGLEGQYGYSGGLAESFLLAGGQTVIGTLWDVRDDKTLLFNQWFYQGLMQGATVANALQSAKRQAKDSAWHARDWSAYVLMGDPDLTLDLVANTSSAPDRKRLYSAVFGSVAVLLAVLLLIYRHRSSSH